MAVLEKWYKAHRATITKNNQIFRQRMSALAAKNTWLRSNFEETQKESAAEKRDPLKDAANAKPLTSSVVLVEELEQLRQALEQALLEEVAACRRNYGGKRGRSSGCCACTPSSYDEGQASCTGHMVIRGHVLGL
jgi:hypothetical protein